MDKTITTFARLARRKHELRSKLNQVERELDALELHASKAMADADLDQVKSHGMELARNVDTRVRATTDTTGLVAALRRAKRTSLIGVNWPAFIAYCKQADASKRGLPKAIDGVVKITRISGVKARRVKGANRK